MKQSSDGMSATWHRVRPAILGAVSLACLQAGWFVVANRVSIDYPALQAMKGVLLLAGAAVPIVLGAITALRADGGWLRETAIVVVWCVSGATLLSRLLLGVLSIDPGKNSALIGESMILRAIAGILGLLFYIAGVSSAGIFAGWAARRLLHGRTAL